MKIDSSLHWIYFLAIPWACIFILRGSGLIEYDVLSIELILFIGSFLVTVCVFFSLGVIGFRLIRVVKKINRPHVSRSDANFITILSITYILILGFDFFITKGGSILAITETREQDNLSGTRMSVLGGVIALTSAAPYMLLGLVQYMKTIEEKLPHKWFMSIALFGVAASFLTGGRNSFLIGITIIFSQHILLKKYERTAKISSRNFVLKSVITFCVLFSLYVFAEREMNQGVEPNLILQIFSVKWSVGVKTLDTENTLLNIIYAIMIILVFYFTHALTYLDQYFLSDTSPLFLGAYNFPIPAKSLEILFNVQAFTGLQGSLIQPGVYLSLPGSLYLDFGFFGTLFLGAVLGAFTGVLYAGRKVHNYLATQFLCFLIAMWLLSSLYSVFAIANGFSFIAILFVIWFKNFSNRLTKL